MRLSVVIVSYNVKYFLDQCLESVFGSDLTLDGVCRGEGSDTLELEVFVVDNASVDGSVEMVREKFGQVHLIDNKENVGFAAANNQALRLCTGDYVLLLNPDTIVERDTFRNCVAFYASHADCGGLTVKMINGEGKYLKESKRGFPTPAAAFYKMSGLIHLFPHSRRIAAYYMGHLDDDETNPIDILPGAYLMISREALEKVGLLDEAYFMYGEDIDFSWRIKLAGFENYYLPSSRIIHYKGESTKHASMNYVYTYRLLDTRHPLLDKEDCAGHCIARGGFCRGFCGLCRLKMAVGHLLGLQRALLPSGVHLDDYSRLYPAADAWQLAVRRV